MEKVLMSICSLRRSPNLVNSTGSNGASSRFLAATSDDDLVRQCARQDEAALEELVKRYQPTLQRVLGRMVNSSEDVEEAVLTVFLKVWQYAPRFQFRSRVSTWIYRIAMNLAHDIHAKNSRQPKRIWHEEVEESAAAGNAEEEALTRLGSEQQAGALRRSMERLSASDRVLLTLYYYEQMEYEQIQEVLGCSYTILKTRLTRARQRLRRFLEDEERGVEL